MAVLNAIDFDCKSTPSNFIIHTHFHEHNNSIFYHLMKIDTSSHTYQLNAILSSRVIIQNFLLIMSHDLK